MSASRRVFLPLSQLAARLAVLVTVLAAGIFGARSGVAFAAPAAPTNVAAVAGVTKVTLTWKAITGVVTYKVFRGTTSGGQGASPYKTVTRATTLNDTAVVNGTTYYYQVVATKQGDSPRSAEVSATPRAAPAVPTGLSAVAGNTVVNLSWAAAANSASYNLYRGTAANGQTLYKSSLTATTYTDTAVVNGTSYYYKVTGVNPVAESARSAEVVAKPVGPPAVPGGFTVTGASGALNLKWLASPNATSYSLYRGTATGALTLFKSGITVLTYADAAVTYGTRYFYAVMAVNGAGQSALSAEVNAVAYVAPAVPTGLTAVAGNAVVNVAWSAAANAASYNLYRGTATNAQALYKSGLTSLSYADTTVTKNTTYFYKVTAVNPLTESARSTEASARVVAAPLAPTGLTAVAGNAQVKLTWAAAANATSYSIYRAEISGAQTLYLAGVTALTYTDVGVVNNTTYFYKLVAVNGAGSSPLSAEVSAKPVPAAAVPTGLSTVIGNSVVTVSWRPAANAATYNLYRSTSSNKQTLYKSGLTATSYTDTGLRNNTTYYYKVAAVNALGASALSAEVSGKPLAVPAAPTNFRAVAAVGSVNLAWNAASGATSYTIYRSTTAGAPAVLKSGATGTSYVDAGVVNGTTYYYMIAAANSYGLGARSAEVSAKPMPMPAVPTNLQVNLAGTTATLTWSAAANALSYNLYRGTAAGAETLYKAGLTELTYVDAGLVNFTTYFYKVTAVNTVAESARSTGVSVQPMTIPAAPGGVTATAGNATVTVRWAATAGAASYNIYRSNVPGNGTLYRSNVTALAFTDAALTNGTPYFYQITAVNARGESGRSAQVQATPMAPPAAPGGLAAVMGDGTVSISWNAVATASSYNVYRGSSAGAASLYRSGLTATSLSDTGLINNVTYYYQVTAVGIAGESARSAELSATPAGTPPPPACTLGSEALCRAAETATICLWNGSNYQPYATATSTPIGVSGYGYSIAADCSAAIAANVAGAVCNWNGSGYQPYAVKGNRAIGSYSFARAADCNQSTTSSKSGAVCVWDGSRYMLHSIATRLQLGNGSYGFSTLSACTSVAAAASTVAVDAGFSTAVCVYNGSNYQPYSTSSGNALGNVGYGMTTLVNCQSATNAGSSGAVCNWNGYNYQPYSAKTGQPIGGANRGFANLTDCTAATGAGQSGAVCNYNGSNYQPYSVESGAAIGKPGYGFSSVSACNAATVAGTGGAVCNWNGNNYQPYRAATGTAIGNVDYGFSSQQACTDATAAVSVAAKNAGFSVAVCNWNGSNYQPYSVANGGPIGKNGYGYSTPETCRQATTAGATGAVCSWNGSNYQPYLATTGRPVGKDGYGYTTLSDCANATSSSASGAVCNWNGFNYQPHSSATGVAIGFADRGFSQLQECTSATSNGKGGAVCNWNGSSHSVYSIANGAAMGTGYSTLAYCTGATAANRSGAVCGWDGNEYQAYSTFTQNSIGQDGEGFYQLNSCQTATDASAKAVVCNWDNSSGLYRPYSTKTGNVIGNYGSQQLASCNTWVQ